MRSLLASTAAFVFGVVPASALVLFAIVLGATPLYGLFQVDVPLWKRLVILLLGTPVSIGAVLGYMGLFEVVGGTLNTRVAVWLLAGVVANLVGIGIVLVAFNWSVVTTVCLFVPPLVVGCTCVAKFVAGSRERGASV